MKKSTFLIAGKHAVVEALKNPKRKVLKIFLTEDSKKSLNKDNQDLNLLKNIKLFYKTKKELDRLCSKEQISHQGLIAEIEHLENTSIKDYLLLAENKKNFTFVALEEVTDPRNIGSIIRSATAFNINGLIVKERSFPSESKLLYKSASGCLEHINIFEVSNINTTLKYLKTKNFWICGFDKNGNKDFTKHNERVSKPLKSRLLIPHWGIRILPNTTSVSPKPQKSRLLIPQWGIRILPNTTGAEVGRF